MISFIGVAVVMMPLHSNRILAKTVARKVIKLITACEKYSTSLAALSLLTDYKSRY